jgi:RHS repeat-associated protein
MHTNIFANGQLIATYKNDNQTYFHFNDWLGNRRLQTNAAGDAPHTLTCTNYPFGDGLSCSGSGTDATEHHFTGKERDGETGLDYFGARYYASGMGRWMSPDWSDSPDAVPFADFTTPRSLNLYSYALNNPLSSADEDGHLTCDPDTWDSATNTLHGGSCHLDWSDVSNFFGNIAQKAGNSLSNATQLVSNYITATRDPGCMAGAMAGGATAGGIIGGVGGGLVGGAGGTLVAPGVGTLGGGATGAFEGAKDGALAGAAAGGVYGFVTCATGSGGGGGGSSASSAQTGRGPENLKEQLAAEQAASNPKAGRPLNLRNGMSDPRWPGSQGWVKMSQNINGVEVHYNFNTVTEAVADVKIK